MTASITGTTFITRYTFEQNVWNLTNVRFLAPTYVRRWDHKYWKGLTACAADPNNDALNEFFHDFLLPFGSLLAPFGRLGRLSLDPGTTPGPFRAQDAKSSEKGHNLAALWPPLGSPIWDFFDKVDDFLAACFLLFFWTPILLTSWCSGIHFDSNLWCFLGYLGPLEIG